jgi:Mor family transcriptional regulator
MPLKKENFAVVCEYIAGSHPSGKKRIVKNGLSYREAQRIASIWARVEGIQYVDLRRKIYYCGDLYIKIVKESEIED